MATKKFDFVIIGVSSFVGQILTGYVFTHIGLSRKVKWAIAGRSGAKLNELRNSLGEGAAKLPIMITVVPYALYGEALVKACAENGNDYCDLTGEAYWINQMIVKYEKLAKKSGARIVNCCGVNSIPYDLGNHFLQKHAKQQFGTFGFIDTALTRKNLGEKGIKEMTAQVPAKRLGTPEEVASFVVWLVCPENTFISGQNIAIDGGFTRTR